MTKFLSLLMLSAGIGILAGCAEDNSSNSGAAVTPEVSNYVDISTLPIEVGEYSAQTYTFRIANPFDNATYEPADNASADVILTYNGNLVTNITNLDKDSTTGNLNTDLIILSTTCGNGTTYGTVPTVLAKGQGCEFTYKIAPKAAFMYVNRLAVEYKKQNFFGTSATAEPDPDSTILSEEALIKKAKASGAYQLNETILKYAGKRSEVNVNGTVYRDASQGTEVNHIFSKANGSLTNGAAGETVITETFDGGTNGATHTITFLDINNNAGTITPFVNTGLAEGVSAKMNMDTSLLTYYQYRFDSPNNSCKATVLTDNTMTITCNPNGSANLTIGLKTGDDLYYKEKYLKYDKAYYVTSTYTPAATAQAEPVLNVYLLLQRDNSSSAVADNTNIDLDVKCWESADSTGNLTGNPQALTNLELNIFKKYNNTYNTDGSISSTATDYVTVKGMCGAVEVNTEYPLTSFTHQTGEAAPTLVNQVQTYSPVETNPLDGIVRHNLMAR